MKRVISSRTILTALLIATLLVVGFIAGQVTAGQPRMRAALDSLRVAKSELEQAAPGKGGHRARALEHVNAAIAEVKAGIEYAE